MILFGSGSISNRRILRGARGLYIGRAFEPAIVTNRKWVILARGREGRVKSEVIDGIRRCIPRTISSSLARLQIVRLLHTRVPGVFEFLRSY